MGGAAARQRAVAHGADARGRASPGATSPQTSLTGVARGTVACGSQPGSTQPRVWISRHSRPHRFPSRGGAPMEVLYANCCGLDVHKKTVVACLLRAGADGRRGREVRTFATMTDDL